VGNLVGFLDGLGVGLAVGFSVGFTVGLSLGLSLLSLGYSVGEEVISIKFEPGLATGILTTGTGIGATGGRVGYLRKVGRRVGCARKTPPPFSELLPYVGYEAGLGIEPIGTDPV